MKKLNICCLCNKKIRRGSEGDCFVDGVIKKAHKSCLGKPKKQKTTQTYDNPFLFC